MPYPDSRSSSTCMSNWTSTISSCIDGACSVSVSSTNLHSRISMFFTPSHDSACQQSSDLAATQPRSMLQLRPGICQTNSYPLQSFLISTGQNGIQQDCSLGLFEQTQCAGGTREVPLDISITSTGQCWFVGGQSVMLSCGERGTVSDNQGRRLAETRYPCLAPSADSTNSCTQLSVLSLQHQHLYSNIDSTATLNKPHRSRHHHLR
jgi:hypothetical protein